MLSTFRCCLVLAGAAALAAAGLGADPPPRPPAPAKPASDKDDQLTPLVGPPVGEMKVPPGAVLVVVSQLKNALAMIPGAIVLPPQKYQELLHEIEDLKRRLDPGRPVTPTSCVLKGQLTRDGVNFTADFAFRTERPDALVALGCPQGAATGVKLDEHLPAVLPPGDAGYVIQVESPGEHHVTLEFRLPILVRALERRAEPGLPRPPGPSGSEQRIELGLPRAAITTLELDLPSTVGKVRLGGQPRARPADNRYSLGATDRLELAWEEPAPGPAGPPLLEADAQITVRVDEVFVTTEAVLALQARRGRVSRWRLLLPPQASVQPEPATRGEVEIDPPGKGPLRTVRLKEPSAEPVVLRVQVRQARAARRLPVGPFVVLDAVRQWGNIRVSAPSDMRLVFHRHGDVSQRELTEEPGADPSTRAAFTYWNLPAAGNPSQLPPAPLELEVEALRGAVEARVAHTVRLAEPGKPLTVVSRFDLTPFRARIDRVDVQLPAGYRYDAARGPSAQLVERVVTDADNGVAQVYLVDDKDQAFTLTLTCRVPLPSDAQQVALDLPRLAQALDRSGPTPRPVSILDRGGQLTVSAPEWLEVTARGPGLEAPAPGKREASWTSERAPVHADLAWRPPPLESVAHVFLTEHRARVRQRMRLRLPDVPAGRVFLDLPRSVVRHLPLGRGLETAPQRAGGRSFADEAGLRIEGGRLLEPEEVGGTVWAVALDRPAGEEHVLTLDYAVDLEVDGGGTDRPPATGARRVEVPLVWPARAGQAETRVRLWCDESLQPTLARPGWEQSAWTEVADDEDSVPTLVLRSRQKRPLTLSLRETGAVSVVVERALIRVTVGEDGHQSYQADYRLSRLLAGSLPVEWPAPPAGLDLHVTLDGKPVRVRGKHLDLEPYLFPAGEPFRPRKARFLHIAYQLPGDPVGGHWNLRTQLSPPLLAGNVLYEQVRWQVDLPPGWVPLSHGGGHFAEQRWGWRGRLLTPRPAVSAADLERWFGTPEGARPAAGEPSLVCWQTAPEALRVTHLPTQVWLLVCSLVFVVTGLGCFWAPLPRAVFWSLLVLLCLAVAVGSILEPHLISALAFGCEPGLLVLLMVLGVQWLLQRRYRRQVVFMPGFTRLKQGSSLIRGSSNRPRAGEPSTIDAPAVAKEGAAPSELRP